MVKIIGILSMQRVINYGSFLQAYALKQLLSQNGTNEVCFIDINPGRQLPGFSQRTLKVRFKKILHIVNCIICGKLLQKVRNKLFYTRLQDSIRTCFPLLRLEDKPERQPDIVVIGSDEVFNCCQRCTWGYTLQLYGDIPYAQKVISYAGSFGHTTYEQLKSFNIDHEIGSVMQKLAAISVRDDNSCQIVKKLTGREPLIHLDPVLIYGYEEEIAKMIVPQLNNYMIVYSYQDRINDKKEIKEICRFAKENRKQLISIFCRYDWCDEAIIPTTPFEVLSWFKGADYVITDTFHGTIFSIITKKRFGTLIRPTNKQKLTSLLTHLRLAEQQVIDIGLLADVLIRDVNYIDVNKILKSERKKAVAYLYENVR